MGYLLDNCSPDFQLSTATRSSISAADKPAKYRATPEQTATSKTFPLREVPQSWNLPQNQLPFGSH
jgi:hypothetical protein